MRADRLLSILLLLQVHRRLTSRELAQRLEVSERTIHRDMEALGATGIPITAERGVGGGWGLLEEYRTNLTGLNEAEIQAIFLTRPAHLLADLGLHKASEAALIKLLAALPAMHRRNAEYIRQRIHIDVTGWHAAEENVSCLPTLQEAIWQERKLHFTYLRGDSAVERLADPLGLVAKGSVWYLVAAIEDQVRSYRVSRIQNAHLSEQTYIRPSDFDLAAYWTQSATQFKANLPRYPVVIRVAADVLSRVYHVSRLMRIEQVDPPDGDGWSKLCLQCENVEEASAYILSLGAKVEIIEPPELREHILELAQGVIATYASLQ